MAASNGRDLAIKLDATLIAMVRTKSVSINREPIDVTTDDDAGWRALLAEPGERQVDLSVSGVAGDGTLRDLSMEDPAVLSAMTIEWPNGDSMTGDFFLNSYSESGEYNGSITFDASLQSSGAQTYTAAT